MQFLLIKSTSQLKKGDIQDIKNKFNNTTSILCDYIEYEWISNDKQTYFIGRNPNLEIYEKYNVFLIDKKNNLKFIHGWLKDQDKDELMDVYSWDDNCQLDGFFNMGIINSEGLGEIFTSKLSPLLYYAKSKEYFAISNRISTLSKVFSYNKINKKYIALHIQYQSTHFTRDTMYEKIFAIPFSSKINFGSDLKIIEVYDYLYDASLEKKYLENKDEYWDDCYKKMKSQVNAFVNLGVTNNFLLGISGGKDSRLLLALFHEHINSTFTWGPVFSPENIVGKMVCNILNVKHEVNYSPLEDSRNLMEFMPQHLFAREFEMCPWDFGTIHTVKNSNITIDGQEYVRIGSYSPLKTKKEIIEDIVNAELSNNFAISDYYNNLIIGVL